MTAVELPPPQYNSALMMLMLLGRQLIRLSGCILTPQELHTGLNKSMSAKQRIEFCKERIEFCKQTIAFCKERNAIFQHSAVVNILAG